MHAIKLLKSAVDWSKAMQDAIVAADTEMLAFKTVLVSETESLYMADVFRLLAKLPTRTLAPLRGNLAELSRDRPEDWIRQKASDLLVAMDMDGV